MNAIELAGNIATCEPNLGKVATDCADMIRQQQAEIETLRNHGYKTQYELLRIECVKQKAEIEELLQFIDERGETRQLIIWRALQK